MSMRLIIPVGLAVITLGCVISAQAAPGYQTPRTSFGTPDLDGTWTNQTATRLERPKEFKDLIVTEVEMKARAVRMGAAKAQKAAPKASGDASGGNVGQGESEFVDQNDKLMVIGDKARSSIITSPTDGRLPFTEEGRRLSDEAKSPQYHSYDNPEDRSASERCIASPSQAGPPMMSGPDDANYQIVQTRDRLGILSEMIHDVRTVRIGGTHPQARLHPVQGDSIGHWEGDTLVIETVDQSPLTSVREVDGSTFWLSPEVKIVERLRRISQTEILYDFTVDDPRIYRQPWSGEMVLRKVEKPIFEYACHEGNYALANILSGAREKEKRERATKGVAER